METRTHRPDLHVVQQSRRDKLRVQNIPSSSSSQYLGDYSGNCEHWSLQNQGPNMDLAQLPSCRYGNISYEQSVLSSEMLNFGSDSQSLVAHKNDAVTVNQEPPSSPPGDKAGGGDNGQFSNSFNHFVNVSGEAQNWKSVGSQQQICCDWNNNVGANYSSVSPMAVGGSSSSRGLIPNNCVPVSGTHSVKPGYFKYNEAQSNLSNTTTSVIPGQFEDLQFSAYCPEVTLGSCIETKMTSVSSLANPRESGRGSWLDSRSELHLLPTYADQSSVLCVNSDSEMVNRAVEGWQRNDISSTTQALSLSLSSLAAPSKPHFGAVGSQHNVSGDLNCGFDAMPGLRPLRSDYLYSSSKQLSKMLENAGACQDTVVRNSTLSHLNVVPFGPFTGYATILKSSRFLKPAQQLLDEVCSFSGHSALTVSALTKRVLDEICLSNDGIEGDNSGLSSTLFGSNGSGVCSSSNESYLRSEYQQTRVKLLYMQEEVCRRYSQYHQQMHMVVSSFESVAGLSAATPYILLALKTISRSFYSIKSAISDQLRNIRKTLGQQLLSHAGRSKGDRVSSSLKLADHPLEKQRAIGSGMGFLDPQPQVWRPQRGLPERAVAVLRAWLFDHFLHPYPTDADKHMLATQTGLTRNQVSNWFINARVRVWKPMVEEIHMLETKAMSNVGKPQVTSATEGATTQHLNGFAFQNESQYSNRLSMRGIPPTPGLQAECCTGIGERSHPASWSTAQEKQSRINCHIPAAAAAGMDGPLMGFMPYHHQNNLEIGGLGSVSLTLGLRQSAAEGVQHEPHQHLGGQIIHDYLG
ncbi:PREDICTED: uncharacterized protein LOC109173615 [Ipomoea nil]|uniref:uncharacterized protein LOC109173615 n=1 Tax=Ipomoea nil TaxID=35883 RepID=UPI000901BE75|nr:PREDICTED: uncharacterized protein LOC109173615 [Ipomoea nil]XP_019178407.1 PREDICTED: uncharacterized protein LOC109173615 [Ipomoea nil]